MSVVENNGINAVLLQQVLNFPQKEAKAKQPEKEKISNSIADIVNLSQSALKKFPETNKLPQNITAQEIALKEKQNELDEKNAAINILSIRSFILKNDEKALNQQANQSKENIVTLI